PTPETAAKCTRTALEAFKGAPLSGEELAQLQAQARAQAVAATKKASKPAAAAAEDDFSEEEEEEEFAGDDEDEEEGDALFIQRGDKLHAAQLRTEYEELQGASKRLKIADGDRAGDSDGDGDDEEEEEEEEERFDYFAAGSVVKCPCTAELVVVSRSEVLDCPACHSTLLPSGEAAVCAPLPQCFAAQPIECFECQAQLEAPLRTTVHAICPGCDSRLAPKAGSAVGPASMQLTQPAAEMIKPEVFEYGAEPEDAAQPMEDAPMGGQHEPEAAAAAGATPTDEDGMLLSNLFLYPQLCRDKRASGDLMVMLVSHEVDARHGKAQFYDDSKLHAAVEEREEQWRGIEFLLQTGQFEERFAAERRRCDERRDERDQHLAVPFPAVLGLDTHSHSEYRADYTTQVFQAEKLRFLDGRPAEDADEPPCTVLAPGAAAANGLGAAAAAAPQPPDDQSSALDSAHLAKAFDERDIPAEYLKTVGGQLDFLANTDSVQSHYEGFEEITREQQLQALAQAGERMNHHGAQINLEPILSDLAQGKTVHLFNIPGRPVSWHGFTALCREINVEVYEQDRKKVIPTDNKTLQRVRVQQPGRVVESRDVFSTMNVRVEQREHEGQPTQDPSGQQDLYLYSFSPDKDKANNERGYDSRFIEGRQKICLVRARCLRFAVLPASASPLTQKRRYCSGPTASARPTSRRCTQHRRSLPR
ncbi:MAG: hypothetical protein VX747_14420, partial [Actinomycetota bacterium]|nr:hypothetical protein [Actinomycetota bacterium]